MAGSFRLSIKLDSSWHQQEKLRRELPKRMRALQAEMAYQSAKRMRDFIQKRLPTTKDYRGYREGLEIAKVRGTSAGEFAFAIQIDPKNRFVREIKPRHQLLWVQPVRKMSRRSQAVAVLAQFNPWTYDSLPFKPASSEAVLVTRKAKGIDVWQTTQKRLRDRKKWAPLLARTGVKSLTANKGRIPRDMASLPDVTLDALTLEFGLGGGKPKPAWRLGFMDLKKKGFSALLKDPRFFTQPLTKPSFSMWKKWPERTKNQISVSQAKRYQGFQNKVRVR